MGEWLVCRFPTEWPSAYRLALWHEIKPDGFTTGTYVISASLDETLRRWPLQQLLDPSFVFEPPPPEPKEESKQLLSQEEEDELAALLDD